MYEEEVENKMMREVERDREEGRGLAGSQQRVGRGRGGGWSGHTPRVEEHPS